jgi:hypothetical protein
VTGQRNRCLSTPYPRSFPQAAAIARANRPASPRLATHGAGHDTRRLQVEWQTRTLPLCIAQMLAEARGCEHSGRPEARR